MVLGGWYDPVDPFVMAHLVVNIANGVNYQMLRTFADELLWRDTRAMSKGIPTIYIWRGNVYMWKGVLFG